MVATYGMIRDWIDKKMKGEELPKESVMESEIKQYLNIKLKYLANMSGNRMPDWEWFFKLNDILMSANMLKVNLKEYENIINIIDGFVQATQNNFMMVIGDVRHAIGKTA